MHIDGYWEVDIHQKIHLLDSWSWEKWVNYSEDNIVYFWFGPAPGDIANVKSDDPDLAKDTDDDGINDFDEKNRFHTDFTQADSDGAQVFDMKDLWEYLFIAVIAQSRWNPIKKWPWSRR